MDLEKFTRAVLDATLSDKEVLRLFLDLEISSESDSKKAVEILQWHRPVFLKILELAIATPRLSD